MDKSNFKKLINLPSWTESHNMTSQPPKYVQCASQSVEAPVKTKAKGLHTF